MESQLPRFGPLWPCLWENFLNSLVNLPKTPQSRYPERICLTPPLLFNAGKGRDKRLDGTGLVSIWTQSVMWDLGQF